MIPPRRRPTDRHALSLREQFDHMERTWPSLSSKMKDDVLRVRGIVQPTPITAQYEVQLESRRLGPPIVRVLAPALVRRAADQVTPIPHTYDALTPGRERPCLYYHPDKEWTPAKPLATTVVPWLLSWLVDYELWHATGEWMGGGMSHGQRPKVDAAPEAA